MKKQSNNKLFKLALASTMAAGAVVAVAPQADAAGTSFTDLTPEKSHYDTVMNLFERGLISGYEDKTFKPNEAIKRGHAALIISNILGLDTENVTDPGFTDVPKTHPYYGAIAALANKGIINGFPDHTYGVNQTLTRGQMAVIISNAFELEGDVNALPFTDIAKSPYKAQIAALYTNKVTVGKTATTFDAISPVTRGQLATFVVKAEEASKVVAATEVVVEIKDGLVVTDKGTYAIDEETAKVFNEANAAALKDAKVKLVVESNPVAAVNFVAAGEPKIVGIEALTLVAADATFDAGGYNIPNVTVNGNNIEVKNVVADTISIADGLTVDLKGVEAGEITVAGNSKITLDSASKITKLVLPAGKKVQDVVSNYSQIRNVLNNIYIVDEAGTKVDVPSSSGGGGGGGGRDDDDESETEKGLDKAIKALVDKYDDNFEDYGTAEFNKDTNRITVTFTASNETTIASIREFLRDEAAGLSLSSLITEGGLTFPEARSIMDNASSVKITAGEYSDTFDVEDFISNDFDVDRTAVVRQADKFVDLAIARNGGNVVNIGQFKTKFANNIKIEAGGITYYVTIK